MPDDNTITADMPTQETDARGKAVSGLAASSSMTIIPGLDGLRAVAVSLVIAYHYGVPAVPGGYGVTLFFVLSGFLITRLLIKEKRQTGEVSFRRFYIRRSLRIFPAFYAYWFGIVFLLVATGRAVNWPHAFSSFVYFSNYFNAIRGDPNTAFSHTRSLAIEEQFYLIWPALLLLLWRRPERALGMAVIALAGLWALRLALVMFVKVPQSYVYASFETRADALLVGCIAAMAVDAPAIARRLDAFARRIAVPVLGTIAVLALSAVELRYGTFFRDTVSLLLLPLVFVSIILHVTAVSNGPVTRFLEIPIMRYVGRISYAMYLYQQIAVYPMRRLTAHLPVVVQVVAVFLVIVVLGTASYYLVERPFLKLKDRFASVRTPKVDHPATLAV